MTSGSFVKRPDTVEGVRGRLRYGDVAPPLLKQTGQPLGTGEIVFNQKDLRTFHASKGGFGEGRCALPEAASSSAVERGTVTPNIEPRPKCDFRWIS